MSWVPDKKPAYSWLESFMLKLVKCGQVPKHVAFIMDGNRRYARQNNLGIIDGHTKGFNKLSDILQWCHDLDIPEVTVYAFSIENYKRPQAEVDALFNLAREKFRWLIDEREKLRKHGLRVRIIGKLDLLPADLKETIRQAMDATKNNSKCVLNVAFSYTSREEIAQAVRKLAEAVEEGILSPDDIDEHLLELSLYTSPTDSDYTSPDLLIRTSGEVRLSDFLLWQTSFSITYFTDMLWPQFALRNLISAVFYYQRHAAYRDALLNHSRNHKAANAKHDKKADYIRFLQLHHSVIGGGNNN